MKKSGLIALLSATLLFTSCGENYFEYTNKIFTIVDGSRVEIITKETLTLQTNNRFRILNLSYNYFPASVPIGECYVNIQQKIEGSLEKTNVANNYKLTAESGSLKLKFEGDGAFTYKSAMKESLIKQLNFQFSNEDWNKLLNDQEVGYYYLEPPVTYVKVDNTYKTFVLYEA